MRTLRRAEAGAAGILGEITPLCTGLQGFKRSPPQRVVNTPRQTAQFCGELKTQPNNPQPTCYIPFQARCYKSTDRFHPFSGLAELYGSPKVSEVPHCAAGLILPPRTCALPKKGAQHQAGQGGHHPERVYHRASHGQITKDG